MIGPEVAVVQRLGEKPVFTPDDLLGVTGSRATAYRTLVKLTDAGFAYQLKAGRFAIRASFFQPYYLWERLDPSLAALKGVRYFGRSYNAADAKVARKVLDGTVTLDYRAYELTGLQEPYQLFVYVDDVDSAAKTLRQAGFWEGTRGRVALLPRIGPFRNEVQRVYVDCLAYGGRSTLDALAIELLHGDRLDQGARGTFRLEDVLKVRDELSPHGS